MTQLLIRESQTRGLGNIFFRDANETVLIGKSVINAGTGRTESKQVYRLK